ncbi:hypothetical protein [Singulisphaera acidiphila]|uniref:Uncharacterized protein n=1 Tax=Singulisphaera acidiphila (strain ATCC BAA-1392 / DSM 18658 / VKM B-2454 / MOB10) TaxID=886293 RepID=L0DR34_SINAD|nr:hypothetical protein [Singulisphaera acidiphila]AGA31483.1 hypothetical protein Sinac_7448 [Singulisphaera acidiphila DSM 18658]
MRTLSRIRYFGTVFAFLLLALVCGRSAQADRVVDFSAYGPNSVGNVYYLNELVHLSCEFDDNDHSRVADYIWTIVMSGDTCAGGAPVTPPNSNDSTISVQSGRAGKFTVHLHVTYVGDETDPTVPAPPPTDITHELHWGPADCLALIGATSEYLDYIKDPFPAGSGPTVLMQLGGGEWPVEGFNYTLHEKISYTIPAGTPPDFNGGWSLPIETPVLQLSENGMIADVKSALTIRGAVGSTFIEYTQLIGVKYLDLCGLTMGPDPVATLTVKHIRVSADTYRVEVTIH